MSESSVSFVPVWQDNLEDLRVAAGKLWMPRSIGYFTRMFFNPHVGMEGFPESRGYLMKNESSETVGFQCHYFERLYFNGKPVLGASECFLGCNPGYGGWLFDLLDKVDADDDATVSYANTLANKKALSIATSYRKFQKGPDATAYIRSGYATFFHKIYERATYRYGHRISGWMFALSKLGLNILATIPCAARLLGVRFSGFKFRIERGFDEDRFGKFWNGFLAKSEGLISSRDVKTLQWKFDASIAAGTVTLISASRNDQVEGYVLMRKYFDKKSRCDWYKIIDVCAMGNDTEILRSLVKRAHIYVQRVHGIKLQYIGGQPKLEAWLRPILRHITEFETTTSVWRTKDAEISESLRRNEGWFFGPYDGERCFGHGGYIDL